MRRFTMLATAAVTALVVLPSALGHVTVNPSDAAAGSFARFAVRVPTERPAATTRVSMRLPEGLFFVSFQPKAGWTREVKTERLAEPVELFGEQVRERVAEVTWSGGTIGPGEFEEFGMSARIPEAEPGTELEFPAVQTYASGEVVRWIGEPDSETPAARVTVLEAEEEGEAASASGPGDSSTRENVALGLAIGALAVSVLALGLVLARRRA